MGCYPSSLNQINAAYMFDSNDIFYLKQSWNIMKMNDLPKFAHDVLIRTSNESSSFRQYWQSKIQVDGNNYDYGQHDSCLKTDSSWQIGLRDYSIGFISIFDQLLSVINDENRFLMQIQFISISESILLNDYEGLLIMKKCMMKILHERFIAINCDSIDDYTNAWEKFLTFVIKYMIKLKNKTEIPSKTMIPLTTTKE